MVRRGRPPASPAASLSFAFGGGDGGAAPRRPGAVRLLSPVDR